MTSISPTTGIDPSASLEFGYQMQLCKLHAIVVSQLGKVCFRCEDTILHSMSQNKYNLCM
jgi:hypothetical protein